MKQKTRFLALLMILVLIPALAQAGYVVDETTFNKVVRSRMIRSSTLYKATMRNTDEGIEYSFEPIGTLAAGKYVSYLGDVGDKAEVFYWNGGKKCAWIDKDACAVNVRTIYAASYATSGRKATIPVLAWGDEAAVRYVLSEFYSPEEVQDFIDGMRQGLTGEKDENGKIVIVKQEPLTPPTITMQADGASAEVELLLPGVVNSTIRRNGEEMTVPTASLSWERDGAAHALARIYAPKKGVASVYARDEGRGGVIKKFKTGSIVLVLGKAGKYTKVFGEGTVGYVITSALEFMEPCAQAEHATVRRGGYLHLVARANGYRLVKLPEGAGIDLISEADGWALTEYEGFAGYVETSMLNR
ncbi:MAG: hypothetical protein ACI4WX_00340 [Aristaeellaceae bacterium]